MIFNCNCTILTRQVNGDRKYSWNKTIYKDVYFECNRMSTGENPKSEDNCYCCIYNKTSINTKIGDIIVKGEFISDDLDITKIKQEYEAYSITKIEVLDTGNIKHIEIEGA